MKSIGAKSLWLALLCASSLFLTACAGSGGLFADETPPFKDPRLTVQVAREMLIAGQTKKTDVAALLGPAASVRFDSGYEVWVYRAPAGREMTREELVILFEPSGVLKKTRIRPSYKSAGR